MKNFALFVSGIIMLAISGLHFYRLSMKTPITVGTFSVPLEWSMYGGVAMLVLALFMFLATRR